MRELVTKVIARIHSCSNDFSRKDCVVPKNIHTLPPPSTEGTIALDPPPPWNFGMCQTWNSNFVRHTMERIFPLKMLLRYKVEPLYNGHLGYRRKRPLQRGFKQKSMYGFFVRRKEKKEADSGGSTVLHITERWLFLR